MSRTPHDGALAPRVELGLTPKRRRRADAEGSKDSAAHVEDHGPVEDRHWILDGYTVNFVSFSEAIDATPLMKGLPGRQVPMPALGLRDQGPA